MSSICAVLPATWTRRAAWVNEQATAARYTRRARAVDVFGGPAKHLQKGRCHEASTESAPLPQTTVPDRDLADAATLASPGLNGRAGRASQHGGGTSPQ